MTGKKKYYAVIRGFRPGIYKVWFGPGGAEEQINGFAKAVYKGFESLREAEKWLAEGAPPKTATNEKKESTQAAPEILIYTDGGCQNNPGPGGYGAVIMAGNKRNEISQGYRMTTNNRMELMACVAALKSLESRVKVVLHSDSRYVVNGMNKGWAKRWKSNGWMRTKTEAAENADLWSELLDLTENRDVSFVWVRGHAGNIENERCDKLATDAAFRSDLREDVGYRKKEIKKNSF
jgi:ribonuclease HI